MKRLVAVAAVICFAFVPAMAAACWCGGEDFDPGYVFPPTATESASVSDQAAALGLHPVTTVWAGDIVATSGDTTTYSSQTVDLNAGTYANLVATVGTGETSSIDGLSSNTRLTMSDGTGVAGDYYANYVVVGGTVLFDRYVFFADDSETARRAAAPVFAPAVTTTATPIVPVSVFPAYVAPQIEEAPAPAPYRAPERDDPPARPPRDVRAAVALAPQADPLSRSEVLRGRKVRMWIRATVDGSIASVRSWTLTSGDVVALGPVSGSGDEPFIGTWEQLAAPGSAFSLRFSAVVDVAGEGARRVEAVIEVVVRSPALVEPG